MNQLEPIAVRADAPTVLDLPPAHLELRWRALHSGDVDALFGLIGTIESADKAPARTSRAEVAELFVGSWKDLQRDSLGGFDHEGTLRAYAFVEVHPGDTTVVRAFLAGGVDPQWRGSGLGRAVIAWLEGRGRQKLVETGKELPARLCSFVEENARDQRRLYAAAGFSPIRWYTTMRRDLSLPVPSVRPPHGVRIVRWSPELDEATRVAHNTAFTDHWGSEPRTVETWSHDRQHFMPTWSFLALDEAADEPTVIGYALSSRFEQDWEIQGWTSGYTEVLGVLPGWRGKGLAGVLLARSMNAFKRSRMQYACLDVDNANPTGANGLYRAWGYEATHGSVLYSVEL